MVSDSQTQQSLKSTKERTKNEETYKEFLDDHIYLFNKLNKILPNFDYHIKHFVNVVMHTLDIKTRKLFMEHVDVSFGPSLKNIILTQNQLLNADAHPIGIELSNYFNSSSAQTILNVKHLNVAKTNVHYTVPILNSVILHQQTDNQTWFRLRCKNVNSVILNVKQKKLNCKYKIINDTILEVVYKGDNRSGLATERTYYDILKGTFDDDENVLEIIFYSNCRALIDIETTNYNLIYSNIFKFYYCHRLNKLDTTYSHSDLDAVLSLQIHCYMLMINKNFNTNGSKLLQPFTLLSSEKNNAALMATQNKTFATDAPRDTHLLGEGSSIGGKNKANLILKIK